MSRQINRSIQQSGNNRRTQKRQERERQLARERRQQLIVRSIIGVVALAVLAFLGYQIYIGTHTATSGTPIAHTGPLEGTQVPASAVGIHIPFGAKHDPYSTTPPTSGPHYSIQGVAPAPPGISDKPVANEIQVHDLEHGAIMIQYNPKLTDPQLIGQLQSLYNEPSVDKWQEKKIIVAPYPDMPQKIAFTAWGWYENFDSFDKDRMLRFINDHIDHGPEDAPI